jgi:hypothetical protein
MTNGSIVYVEDIIHSTKAEIGLLSASELKQLTDWPFPVIEDYLRISRSIFKLNGVIDDLHRARTYFHTHIK